MKTRNITQSQLEQALQEVNKKYNGNVKMDITCNFLKSGLPRHSIKIGVHSSFELGGSYNPRTERRVCSACWHVFGDFLDSLGEICKDNEDAIVILMDYDYKDRMVHPLDHNWLDLNVGSQWYPMYQSEKCKCDY